MLLISSYQQTCRANREWRLVEFTEMKEKWWENLWKEIKKIVGKFHTDKMKQGSAIAGTLFLGSNQIDAKACEYLAPEFNTTQDGYVMNTIENMPLLFLC